MFSPDLAKVTHTYMCTNICARISYGNFLNIQNICFLNEVQNKLHDISVKYLFTLLRCVIRVLYMSSGETSFCKNTISGICKVDKCPVLSCNFQSRALLSSSIIQRYYRFLLSLHTRILTRILLWRTNPKSVKDTEINFFNV